MTPQRDDDHVTPNRDSDNRADRAGDDLARADRDIDAVLRGRFPADRPDLEPLIRLVEDVHTAVATPARPNAELAALLASGLAVAPVGSAAASSRQAAAPAVRWYRGVSWSGPAVRWYQGVSWGGPSRARKIATAVGATTFALLSITTAAAAGVLPDPVQDKVSTAVETVTPWRIPRPDGNGGVGEDVREKARKHGRDKDKKRNKDDKDKKNNDATSPSVSPSPATSSVSPSPSATRPAPGNSDHSKIPPGHIDVSETPKPKPSHAVKPTSPGNSDHGQQTHKPAKPVVMPVKPTPGVVPSPTPPVNSGKKKPADTETPAADPGKSRSR